MKLDALLEKCGSTGETGGRGAAGAKGERGEDPAEWSWVWGSRHPGPCPPHSARDYDWGTQGAMSRSLYFPSDLGSSLEQVPLPPSREERQGISNRAAGWGEAAAGQMALPDRRLAGGAAGKHESRPLSLVRMSSLPSVP